MSRPGSRGREVFGFAGGSGRCGNVGARELCPDEGQNAKGVKFKGDEGH